MLTDFELGLWAILENYDGPDSILAQVPLLSSTFRRPTHLKPLAEELFKAAVDGGMKLCISVPPRHSKTETLMAFVIWYLKRNPTHTVAYLMHTASLAQKKSSRLRDLAIKAGLRIRKDTRAKMHWMTAEGGGVDAMGTGASPTGLGFNLIIVDDPIKSRADAESGVVKEKVYEWLRADVFTRLEPKGNVVVCHTRWSPDDPIGRLLNEEDSEWKYINLPAIDTEGKALWPSQWDEKALDKIQKNVGEYNWFSMYQGEPRPRGMQLFGEPARYQFADLEGARFCMAVDPAASTKTTADYSVICVMAAKGDLAYVLDIYRGQVTIPQLIREIHGMQRKWGLNMVYVESVAGFKAVPQMLREIDKSLKVVDINPLGDKFTRALPAAAAWSGGRLQVPADNPKWLREYLKEMQAFTGVKDPHDDQVDATAHAYNILTKKRTERRVAGVLLPFVSLLPIFYLVGILRLWIS